MPSNDYCSFERSKERKLALDEMSIQQAFTTKSCEATRTALR